MNKSNIKKGIITEKKLVDLYGSDAQKKLTKKMVDSLVTIKKHYLQKCLDIVTLKI